MARETGTVKWFSNEKGYGFIERHNGEDVFVHHSDIRGEGFRTLRQGETVEFEIMQEDRGPKALDVLRSETIGEQAGAAAPADRDRGRGTRPGGRSAGRDVAAEGSRNGEEEKKSLAAQIREKLGRRFLGFSR